MADQALGLHTVIYTLVDGQLLTRATSCTVEHASNSPAVKTVVLGFAGVTPGAPMANVTIECALPADDMELNPTPKLRLNTVVELGVIISGRQSIASGFLTKVNYKHGVDENAVQSIEGIFRMSDFE